MMPARLFEPVIGHFRHRIHALAQHIGKARKIRRTRQPGRRADNGNRLRRRGFRAIGGAAHGFSHAAGFAA